MLALQMQLRITYGESEAGEQELHMGQRLFQKTNVKRHGLLDLFASA